LLLACSSCPTLRSGRSSRIRASTTWTHLDLALDTAVNFEEQLHLRKGRLVQRDTLLNGRTLLDACHNLANLPQVFTRLLPNVEGQVAAERLDDFADLKLVRRN